MPRRFLDCRKTKAVTIVLLKVSAFEGVFSKINAPFYLFSKKTPIFAVQF